MSLFHGQTFYSSAEANATVDDPPRHTRAELDALREQLTGDTDWLNDALAKQAKLRAHDDPALKRVELERRQRAVEAELARLKKKKAPRRTSTTTTTAEPTPSADETTTAPARATDEL